MAQGVEQTFLPGETIVREGDPADRFYIIESGQVEGKQSAKAGEVHVLTMQAGAYFGEVGLLATRTRTATVRAVSEVRVVSLDRAQFQSLVDASESTRRTSRRSSTDRLVAQFGNELVQALSAAIRQRIPVTDRWAAGGTDERQPK
jgi:CRP-like cAMP-binding protein